MDLRLLPLISLHRRVGNEDSVAHKLTRRVQKAVVSGGTNDVALRGSGVPKFVQPSIESVSDSCRPGTGRELMDGVRQRSMLRRRPFDPAQCLERGESGLLADLQKPRTPVARHDNPPTSADAARLRGHQVEDHPRVAPLE